MNLKKYIPESIKSRLKIARAHIAEKLGSDRYSYPAINGLDRAVLKYLPLHGIFLEIGANDGYSQSNTFYLERSLGWQGILIEPIPRLYRLCSSHRAAICFNYACVGPDDPKTVELIDRGLMSVSPSLIPERETARRVGNSTISVRVPTATLSSLIERSQLGKVTFISIDVEGAELAVLAGLDLTNHCPDFLLVETSHIEDVTKALSSWMRLAEQLSHHDYLFRAIST